MLRVGGRLFEINHGNNHARPYVILPQPWLYDFFVVNEFADCRLAVCEYGKLVHAFLLQPACNPAQQVGWGLLENFDADDRQIIANVVFAEKGARSTWGRTPVQDAWRNEREVHDYNECLKALLSNPRPPWRLRSSDSEPKSPNSGGASAYHYIGHF
jgi:hypothetical protein